MRLITPQEFERRRVEAALHKLRARQEIWKHFAPEPPMADPYACPDAYEAVRAKSDLDWERMHKIIGDESGKNCEINEHF